MAFACPTCGVAFGRKYHRDRHYNRVHNHVQRVYDCSHCGRVFNTRKEVQEHRLTHVPTTCFTELRSAFNRKCVIYRNVYVTQMKTLEEAFARDRIDLKVLLTHLVDNNDTIKAALVYSAEFIKSTGDDTEEEYELKLRAPTATLHNKADVRHYIKTSKEIIAQRIDDFLQNGSGWRLQEILYCDIEIGKCGSLNGGCSALSVKYLSDLDKIPIIDINAKGKECFFESVAYYFRKTTNLTILRRFIKEKMICKIPSPVAVRDVARFEKHNAHLNVKINVLYAEGTRITPVYASKVGNKKHIITLLLYKTKVEGEIIRHYAFVENVSALLRKRYIGNGKHITYQKSEHCLNCFCKFRTKTLLSEHQKLCFKNKTQRVVMPKKDTFIEFKNFNKKFPNAIVGYFDFEAALPQPKDPCARCSFQKKTECIHRSVTENRQIPISYALMFIDFNGKVIHANQYSGADCAHHFIQTLLDIEEDLEALMQIHKPMDFTTSDEQIYDASTQCHICEKELNIPDEFGVITDITVRDHCHLSGHFLGAAHQSCNLNRSIPKKIPLFAHNLSGYDSHFIINEMSGDSRIKYLTALPYNTERFRTIKFNCFRFVDSAAFLQAKLDDLVSSLAEDHNFAILDQMQLYNKYQSKRKKLLIRKGIFPYEFATSLTKLKETTYLPPQSEFYSKLNNTNVSAEDYLHAHHVYEVFKCKNMLDYTELYCLTDCCLLAEVMTAFRDEVMAEFKLECGHYISLPQLAFDAMLHLTEIQIEKMTDPDMLMFVEQNIRGGLSFINQRYCASGARETAEGAKEHIEMIFIDGKCNIIDFLLTTGVEPISASYKLGALPLSYVSFCKIH